MPLLLNIVGWLTLGSICFLPALFMSFPWELNIYPSAGTYSIRFGFRKFALRLGGALEDVLGVGVRFPTGGPVACAYSIVFKLKGLRVKNDFILESNYTLEQATERAAALAKQLNIAVVASGKASKQTTISEVGQQSGVRYTQDSTASPRMQHKQLVILGIINIFLPLAFLLPVFSNGRSDGFIFAAFPIAIFWFCSYCVLRMATPWSITLDEMKKSYVLTVGYKLFAHSWRESFNRCCGVSVLSNGYSDLAYPYLVALRINQEAMPRNFPIKLFNNLNEAGVWAQDLALRLGTRIVDAEGKPFAGTETPGNVLLYSECSTIAERAPARLAVKIAQIYLAFMPFAIAGYYLIEAYSDIPFVLTTYWILWLVLAGVPFRRVINGTAWKLTLNNRSRTYNSEIHFGPFIKRSSGSFVNIESVHFEASVIHTDYDPYLITLKLKKNIGRKQFHIEAANNLESATATTAELTRWLNL
jgi:hypothetical protein